MEDKKNEIFNCGKEMFISKGFKNTNISDIAKECGISVGSFYKYYESKDKLFIDIYIEENIRLKKSFINVIDIDGDPVKIIKEIMAMNINGINTNPILKEWYDLDFFSKLEKKFYKEGGIKSIYDLMNGETIALIEKWKDTGKIRKDLDSDLILAIFNSIPYIDIHKEEIGINHFPHILNYITEFIINGLKSNSKL